LVVVVIVVAAEVALAEELEENKGRKEFGWKGARKGGGKERQVRTVKVVWQNE
jgi:hypothetical protein